MRRIDPIMIWKDFFRLSAIVSSHEKAVNIHKEKTQMDLSKNDLINIWIIWYNTLKHTRKYNRNSTI